VRLRRPGWRDCLSHADITPIDRSNGIRKIHMHKTAVTTTSVSVITMA
jgi:hypothetical protein